MVELDLNRVERSTLVAVLEDYLSDLRMEIADTDRQNFRDMLKERKAVVIKAIEAVRQRPTA